MECSMPASKVIPRARQTRQRKTALRVSRYVTADVVRAADTMDGVAYKILTRAQFYELVRDGCFNGSPIDLRDGYIHMSTAAQARATAAKHFAGRDDLVLATVDLSGFTDTELRWEPSRGGDLFPHLYCPLERSAVIAHAALPLGDDGEHVFPAGMG